MSTFSPSTPAHSRVRRSVLYVPAINERAMDKARRLDADTIILDLEDSVAPAAKSDARSNLAMALSTSGFGASEVVVRINGLDTSWGRDDLEVALSTKPDAVLVPKVSTPQDLVRVRQITEGKVPIWAMMETPLAILSSLSIAQSRLGAVPEFSAMVIGINDLAKDTRTVLTPGRVSGISTDGTKSA